MAWPLLQGLDPVYYGAGVAFTAAHLAWQVRTLEIDNVADCHRKFISNRWIGAGLFAAIVAARALGTT
jgi:4-hydroxybenzoate polyprenyltransferase